MKEPEEEAEAFDKEMKMEIINIYSTDLYNLPLYPRS